MMIFRKINFDIIFYSVIFAANLYLSIFVWSSDILNFVFMNVVILVFIRFILKGKVDNNLGPGRSRGTKVLDPNHCRQPTL